MIEPVYFVTTPAILRALQRVANPPQIDLLAYLKRKRKRQQVSHRGPPSAARSFSRSRNA